MSPGVLVFQLFIFLLDAYLICYTGCRLLGIRAAPGRMVGYAAAGAILSVLVRILYVRFHIPFGTNQLMEALMLTALARLLFIRRWEGALAVVLSGMILTGFGAFLAVASIVTFGLDMGSIMRTPAGMMLGSSVEHLPIVATALWLRRGRFALMDLGEGRPAENRKAFKLLLAVLLQTFFLMYIGVYRFTSQMPAFKDEFPSAVADFVYWIAAVVLPVAILIFLRDLDRLVRLERRLREVERQAAIGQMAAGVAHEVRNPLTAIRGHLQLLRDLAAQNRIGTEMAKEAVGDVLRQVDHVVSLTSEFLLLARPREERREPVDVNRIAAEVVRSVAPMADDAGVIVRLEKDPMLPDVLGDGQQLRQVLLNLVVNAIQSRPQDRLVRVETFNENGRVGLRVADSGAGIAPEHLEKIFQPFFTTKEAGTGLGLAIVDRIVRDHGGHIDVSSTPGQGTVVTVYLPRGCSESLTHPDSPVTISSVK